MWDSGGLSAGNMRLREKKERSVLGTFFFCRIWTKNLSFFFFLSYNETREEMDYARSRYER